MGSQERYLKDPWSCKNQTKLLLLRSSASIAHLCLDNDLSSCCEYAGRWTGLWRADVWKPDEDSRFMSLFYLYELHPVCLRTTLLATRVEWGCVGLGNFFALSAQSVDISIYCISRVLSSCWCNNNIAPPLESNLSREILFLKEQRWRSNPGQLKTQ